MSCSCSCSCSCGCSCSCTCLSIYSNLIWPNLIKSNHNHNHNHNRIKSNLSIYLSICKLENEAILRDFLSLCTWQRQKRSNSARLPHFLKLTTSKTKQFCENSSFFEVGNIKNEAVLRDLLQKWNVSAELTDSYQCVLRFVHSICLKYCTCQRKMRPGHTKCCTCNAK